MALAWRSLSILSQSQQQQQQKKPLNCYKCNEAIKLRRKSDGSGGWDRLSVDGTTLHVCNPDKLAVKTGTQINQDQAKPIRVQPIQQTTQQQELAKEISQIKTQLLMLNSRLEKVQEALMHH
jgi:hypothetical protein